jgi:hypothetical protein
MPVSRGRKSAKGAPKPNRPPSSRPSQTQRDEKFCYKILRSLGKTLGWIARGPQTAKDFLVLASVLLGIVASAVALTDYYLQTWPEFVENNSDISSPIALPFAIQMPSIFFQMTNVRLVCDIQNVMFETDTGKKIGFSIPVTSGYVNKANISRKSPGSFDCDAANYLHVENGGINLLGLHADMPGISKIHVLTQTVQIGIKYKILWKEREDLSAIFTWEPTAAGHYWRKGEMLH